MTWYYIIGGFVAFTYIRKFWKWVPYSTKINNGPIPKEYRIEMVNSSWSDGDHLTFIAYHKWKGKEGYFDDDFQLGSYKSLAPAVKACWDNYFLLKRVK